MTMTEDEQHHISITNYASRSAAYSREHYVKCSCGYESGPHTSHVMASDDGDEHVIAATRGD